jgi:glycosyltransferase involved in cell wall biosynthesis
VTALEEALRLPVHATTPLASPKLSVVMPVYNELATIEQIVQAVREVAIPKEIVIVDDGSTDGTRDVLQRLTGECDEIRVVLQAVNGGKGSAIRTGINEAAGDIIIIQDADLEYDPADYHALIAPIVAGNADVVFGSRFLGTHRCFMFTHWLGNKALTMLANVLFNTILTDMETCYKVFRSDFIKQIPLRSSGFDIEPEITAKVMKRGARLYEVPISYAGRGYDEGKKIRWTDGLWAILALIRYRLTD